MRRLLVSLALILPVFLEPAEAKCWDCQPDCFASGTSCGYECQCGCRGGGSDCACFKVYKRGDAEEAGYRFL